MRTDFYDRNHIPVIAGRGTFIDKNTLKLAGKRPKLTADYFIIATGSRPYHPPDVDFDHPRVLRQRYDTVARLFPA